MADLIELTEKIKVYEQTLDEVQEQIKLFKYNDNLTKIFNDLDDKIDVLSKQAKQMETLIQERTAQLEQKIKQRLITVFDSDTDITINIEDWVNYADCVITITNNKSYKVSFTTKINYDLSDLILTQILNSIAMSVYDFFNHTNMELLEVKVW